MKPDDAALRADELLHDSRWIHRIARSLLSDPSAADDLVQEAWVAALAQDETKRDGSGSPRSWLARVLHNLADKRRRSEARRKCREMSCARGEAVASTADLVARAETQRMVVEAVLALPEPYRTAILLAHIEGLSSVEIARSQGVSDNTVRWRIQRGLALLRFELERKRGREWLNACALLLSPADRIVIASAAKAATAGVFAALTPKVAAALTVAVLAGGATVVWRGGATGSRANESVAKLDAPAAAADIDSVECTSGVPEMLGPSSAREHADSQAEATADTSLVRDSQGANQAGVAIAEQLRSTLERVIGPGKAATLASDSVLKKLDEALTSAGVSPHDLQAKWMGGSVGILALDVDEVDAQALILMKPSVYIGVSTVPPR